MVFSSMVFLWIFLPIVVIGYFLVPKKAKNIFLLLASLFFYAWGEPIYILLMLFSICINWILGLFIEKYSAHKKLFLIMDLVINLGLLGFFKYAGFFIETTNALFHTQLTVPAIALPIGISFFTFQAMSYVIDLYRGQYPAQKKLFNLALYISFFPQLIAGPIVKYKDINEQLENRSVSLENVSQGIRRFIYGLGKKVLIANTMAFAVDNIYQLPLDQLTPWLAWAAAIFYAFQVYYDFSGYSDMAIGLGKIFGFHFLENFRYPYESKSIREFWQRWHISLSTWFKEYVYIPLGGNRKGKARTYLNLAIVFFLTGLWHGASFTFIVWGCYHGFFLILERAKWGEFLKKHSLFSRIYTLLVVCVGWVFFRADTLHQAMTILKRMFAPWAYTGILTSWQQVMNPKTFFIAVLALIGCGLLTHIHEKKWKWKYSYVEIAYCALVFLLCLASLASSTYNPFIYFRF